MFSSVRHLGQRSDIMYKSASIAFSILLVIILLTSCLSPKKSTEEENALNSLLQIQNKLEADITYDEFAVLLRDAKPKVDRLKQTENNNRCFISAVDKCYAAYEIAGKAWKRKMETNNDKIRQDMETTFSFSISFATLNIQKANNCYN